MSTSDTTGPHELTLLTEPQLAELLVNPAALLEEVNQRLTNAHKALQQEKARGTRAQLNHEHALTKAEKEIGRLRSELEQMHERHDTAARERDARAEQVQQLQSKSSQDQQLLERLRLKVRTMASERNQARADAAAANQRADKRELELELANEENKRLQGKMLQDARLISTLEERVSDLEKGSYTKEYEATAVERERDLLRQQLDEVTATLAKKKEAHVAELNILSDQLRTLAKEVEQSNLDRDVAQQSREQLLTRNKEQEAQVADLLTQLRDVRSQMSFAAERATQESRSGEQLRESLEARITDLEEQLREARSASQTLSGRLAQARADTLAAQEGTAKAKEELFAAETQWRQQVEELQRQMDGTASMSVSHASAHHKSAKEVLDELQREHAEARDSASPSRQQALLTHFAAKYDEVVSNMAHIRTEKRRLHTYLNELIHEIEEKGPQIAAQKQEYARVVQQCRRLEQQLHTAQEAQTELRHRLADAEQQVAIHKATSKDLGVQLQGMLQKSAQQARIEGLGDTEVSLDASSDPIPLRLLSFSDVAQLQQRNADLLQQLHTTRAHLKSHVATERQSVLSEVAQRMESLRQQRQRQADMCEALTKQRDMYKTLWAQASVAAQSGVDGDLMSLSWMENVDGSGSLDEVLSATPGTPRARNDAPAQGGKGAAKLVPASVLEALRQRFLSYKGECETKAKRDQDHIDSSRKAESEARMQAAEARAEVSFLRQRLDLVEQNRATDAATQQRFAAEASRLQDTILSHERNMAAQGKRVSEAQAEASEWRSRAAQAQQQQAVLQADNDRMAQQVASARAEVKRMESLTQHLNTVMASLDIVKGAQSEVSRRRHADLLAAKARITELEQALERDAEAHEAHVLDLGARVESLQARLVASERAAAAAAAEVQALREQVATHVATQSRGSAEETEAPVATDASPAAQQLQQALDRAHQAEEQAALDRAAVSNYQAIARASEESLSDLQAASQRKVDALKAANKRYNQECRNLEEALGQARAQIEAMADQVAAGEQQRAQQEADASAVRAQLDVARTKLREARAATDVALERERVATERYNEEVERRGRDMAAAQKQGAAVERLQSELQRAEARATELESQLEAQVQTLEARARSAEDRAGAADAHVAQLQEHNKALHTHLETLREVSQSLVAAGSSGPAVAGEAAAVDASGEEPVAAHRLHAIVGYLRREVEVERCKARLAVTEKERMEHQVSQLRQEVDEWAARERARQSADASAHAELARQQEQASAAAQQLATVRDANETLRQRVDAETRRRTEVEAALARAEAKAEAAGQKFTQLAAKAKVWAEDRQRLKAEVGSWKARLDQVVDKYHAIDPSDVSELRQANQGLTDQLSATKQELATVAASLAEARKAKSLVDQQWEQSKAELTTAKTARGKADHALALLKDINRKFKARLKQALAQATELKAQLDAKSAAMEETQSQLSLVRAQVTKLRGGTPVEAAAGGSGDAAAVTNVGDDGGIDDGGPKSGEATGSGVAGSGGSGGSVALDAKEVSSLRARLAAAESELAKFRQQAKAATDSASAAAGGGGGGGGGEPSSSKAATAASATEVPALKQSVERLTKAKEHLEAENVRLKAVVAEHEAEIAMLKGQVTRLKARVSGRPASPAGGDEQLAAVQAKVKELESQNKALSTRLQTHVKAVGMLKARLRTAKGSSNATRSASEASKAAASSGRPSSQGSAQTKAAAAAAGADNAPKSGVPLTPSLAAAGGVAPKTAGDATSAATTPVPTPAAQPLKASVVTAKPFVPTLRKRVPESGSAAGVGSVRPREEQAPASAVASEASPPAEQSTPLKKPRVSLASNTASPQSSVTASPNAASTLGTVIQGPPSAAAVPATSASCGRARAFARDPSKSRPIQLASEFMWPEHIVVRESKQGGSPAIRRKGGKRGGGGGGGGKRRPRGRAPGAAKKALASMKRSKSGQGS